MKASTLIRTLLLIVVSLTAKKSFGYDKFVVPTSGYLTVSQWFNWVAYGNTSGMTVVCDRAVYKEYLYAEIRNRGAICNTDQDFIALYNAGRFGSGLLWFNSLAYPFNNTAWDKATSSVVKLGAVTMGYSYICLDSEPIAKGTCANVINKYVAPKPAPAPIQTGTFNPCDNQYYVLGVADGQGLQWTADGTKAYANGIWYQRFTTDLAGNPYTDGQIHIDTMDCQKVKRSPAVASCCGNTNNYYSTTNNYYGSPEKKEETGPVYSTMGSVYHSPTPTPVAYQQKTTIVSIGFSLNGGGSSPTGYSNPPFQWNGVPSNGGSTGSGTGVPSNGGSTGSGTGSNGGSGGGSGTGSNGGGGTIANVDVPMRR
jgi:hypothetical protein